MISQEDVALRRRTSPYHVASISYIMRAESAGRVRNPRTLRDACKALVNALWKLAVAQPHHIDITMDPDSEWNRDINGIAPRAAAVVYDVSALRVVLEAKCPTEGREIDRLCSRVIFDVLAGDRKPDAYDLLAFAEDVEVREERASMEEAMYGSVERDSNKTIRAKESK